MGTMSTAIVQGKLDYLDSQEPDDAARANAMAVVERLLAEYDVDSFQKVSTDQISRNRNKPASTLGTKVAQYLAKRAECSPFQKSEFDWDSAPSTDECTVGFISRKKQRIHAQTQAKHLPAQSCGGSGSGTRTGFIPEHIDDDSGVNSSKMPEPVGPSDDLYETHDIGPCTQMAAEAMEALSNASTVNCSVRDDEHLDGSVLKRSLGKERETDKISSVESTVENRIGGGSRELAGLLRNGLSPVLPSSRQRRNMSKIRVLFSQSMDKETIKLQTKILTYFGLPVATSISDATHFVTEKFARTRNLLEAIAKGIPVVTPSWLEFCGEAKCFIDEKKYIMRDIKKEKEIGFSMPVSLSRACKKPLLEGQRVIITPHAKPSKEVLKSLVAAAHGQPLERITSPMMKKKNVEGTFVISCEQDRNVCLPLIKNGFEVFDSELLLNGIITQKLDFERYRLFH